MSRSVLGVPIKKLRVWGRDPTANQKFLDPPSWWEWFIPPVKMVMTGGWLIVVLTTLDVPSGKLSHNYGKSPFSMGKSTIFMTIFNSPPSPMLHLPSLVPGVAGWGSWGHCAMGSWHGAPHLAAL